MKSSPHTVKHAYTKHPDVVLTYIGYAIVVVAALSIPASAIAEDHDPGALPYRGKSDIAIPPRNDGELPYRGKSDIAIPPRNDGELPYRGKSDIAIPPLNDGTGIQASGSGIRVSPDSTATAALNDRFDDVRNRLDAYLRLPDRGFDRIGAMDAAYAGIATNTARLGGRNRFGVGAGSQGGAQALALGYQRAFLGNRANVSIGAAFTGGEQSISAGAGFSW